MEILAALSPEKETFYPSSRKNWRQWLQKNHQKKQSIWVICYKKQANVPTITWSEAVDEAICFGWIDSLRQPIDHEKFRQYFCQRKPTSAWSKINKAKVARLTEEGLMTKAGLACIEVAKKNGTWTLLDAVEELKIPTDLSKEFKLHDHSKKFFQSLSRSQQKMILQWIAFAKRSETREKRVKEVAKLAGKGLKPKHL